MVECETPFLEILEDGGTSLASVSRVSEEWVRADPFGFRLLRNDMPKEITRPQDITYRC